MERGDDGVQAAVTAGNHHGAITGLVNYLVQLIRIARCRDLNLALRAQYPQREVDAVAVSAACICVGDHQHRRHLIDPRSQKRRRLARLAQPARCPWSTGRTAPCTAAAASDAMNSITAATALASI